MDPAAHVSSLDAIQSFRSSLLVYLSKARVVIDDASDEIARTREWLRSDRLPYWEGQVRRRKRKLDDAQQALFSSRLSTFRTATSAEQAAVHSAKHALSEAQEKVARIRQWINRFDGAVEVPAKQIQRLHGLVVGQLPGAAAHLARVLEKLDQYAEVSPGRSTTPAAAEEIPEETSGRPSGEGAA